MTIESRRALITGSGAGMGRSHALLLAERGADVIVHDVNADGAAETADGVRAAGRKAHVIVHDIRDTAGFTAAIADAEAALGPVDILVNNAGLSGRGLKFEDIDEETYDALMAVHVKGTFFTTRAVVGGMKQRRWGRIINISSTYGVSGGHNASHYAGAKAALLGFTKTWARELATFGITVNAVAPGFIVTGMTMANRTEADLPERIKPILVGRAGQPADISNAVAFLAAEESSFITGQALSPNGGEYIV